MRKKALQLQSDRLEVEEAAQIKMNIELDHEIECPRCHDIMMTSSSEIDRLDYVCKGCSFLLYLPKKWAEQYLRFG